MAWRGLVNGRHLACHRVMDPDSRVAAPLTPDAGCIIPAGPLPLRHPPVPRVQPIPRNDGEQPSRRRFKSLTPFDSLSPFPARHCLRVATAKTRGRPKRQPRAKVTFKEKDKVRQVRRQGACLRCVGSLRFRKCSLDNPCQPCLPSAVRGFERKVLSFCCCVRTRFADVNIFDTSIAIVSSGTGNSTGSIGAMQIENLMRRMAGLLARIATPASFDLTSGDPQAFNHAILTWLTDPTSHLPNGSIVGLCCSSLLGLQFQDNEPGAAAAEGLVEDLERFLLAASLVHAGWKDRQETRRNCGGGGGGGASREEDERVQTRELYAASHIGGSRLLRRLDRVLTPQFLARCGREQCQVLFLLVLGTAFGVGYASSGEVSRKLQERRRFDAAAAPWETTPWGAPPAAAGSLLSPELQRSPTLWLAMKEHLCQMLAHHLIFVGSMLGIKLDTTMERRIIETAAARWNKAEEFAWADAVGWHANRGMAPSAGPEGPADLPPWRRGAAFASASEPQWSSWAPTPTAAAPAAPMLVPIPYPEVRSFLPQIPGTWENPQSYYDMFKDDRKSTTASKEPTSRQSLPPTSQPPMGPGTWDQDPTEPTEPPRPRRQGKLRSMWVVRPVDAGPEHGLVNFHARLRGGMDMETLRAFV
ncbi:hypothetical protein VTJ83DRAFT_88 [Remersonia thermophila]|uniref:Uncharacterized protein n=1 Tax=Remersonia thermophila TaxID=72144 RepID=A0ABR4DKA0_9PEZI